MPTPFFPPPGAATFSLRFPSPAKDSFLADRFSPFRPPFLRLRPPPSGPGVRPRAEGNPVMSREFHRPQYSHAAPPPAPPPRGIFTFPMFSPPTAQFPHALFSASSAQSHPFVFSLHILPAPAHALPRPPTAPAPRLRASSSPPSPSPHSPSITPRDHQGTCRLRRFCILYPH